ncbi:MAG: hypothetical protein WCA49_04210 [Candidatus Sulfotelmatobacter sp.]
MIRRRAFLAKDWTSHVPILALRNWGTSRLSPGFPGWNEFDVMNIPIMALTPTYGYLNPTEDIMSAPSIIDPLNEDGTVDYVDGYVVGNNTTVALNGYGATGWMETQVGSGFDLLSAIVPGAGQQPQRVSWWQNFTHPNKATCKNVNILAASEGVAAFGFGATAFFAPVTAPVAVPAALAAGGSAALTKLYAAVACP